MSTQKRLHDQRAMGSQIRRQSILAVGRKVLSGTVVFTQAPGIDFEIQIPGT